MNIYKKEFYLSAGEGNAQGLLAVTRLTEILIDIATEHANSLGIGNPVMRHLNAGWVLARLTIEMNHYPRVNDHFSIETWVESWNRHFSERDFRILSESGEVLGYARSVWMVMTTDTHENFGLSHLTLDKNLILKDLCPIQRQSKHRMIEPHGTEAGATELTASQPDDFYTFKYCDIDFYRHVNTVRYVVLLMNRYSMQEMDKSIVQRMELSFMHEGHFGMKVAIRRNVSDSENSSYLILDTATDTPLLYARIRLKGE